MNEKMISMREAAEIVCDYCGGRAFESKGKETPFRMPNDSNWYHRAVSPCRAALLYTAFLQSENL